MIWVEAEEYASICLVMGSHEVISSKKNQNYSASEIVCSVSCLSGLLLCQAGPVMRFASLVLLESQV